MRPLGDRRRRIRLEVVGSLWGALEIDRQAELMNISRTGALIVSPVPAAVEAECHLGMTPAALPRVHKVQVQAECALDRARIEFQAGQYDRVANTLRALPPKEANLGTELQARVHYWRALAFARQGEVTASSAERETGRKLVARIQDSLSDADRERFSRRTTIRSLIE